MFRLLYDMLCCALLTAAFTLDLALLLLRPQVWAATFVIAAIVAYVRWEIRTRAEDDARRHPIR